LGESRSGLAAAEGIVEVDTDAGPAWVSPAVLDKLELATTAPTRLLPGFDEFMLGYSEGERAIDPAHHAAVVPGKNGMFRATVVDTGRVVGLWERKPTAKAVRVTVTPLTTLDTAARSRISTAAGEYAAYVGRPLEVRWADA